MIMMATKSVDEYFPFILKQERGEISVDDNNDDISLDDIDNLLSMPIPSISARNFLLPTDPNDEFLRLTTMVRAVYFSYLHKCLLSNYIVCYKQKNEEIPCSDLKRCANQMELNAVRHSLEASLYRQNMLKLISDIKTHTSERKIFKKLVIFLETPPDKVNVGVQTSSPWIDHTESDVQKADSTQDIYTVPIPMDFLSSPNVSPQSTQQVNSTECCVKEDITMDVEDEVESKMNEYENESDHLLGLGDDKPVNNTTVPGLNESTSDLPNEDENSQDSLLQHMEDMFCESDDSSDLTTLIEKHSGISKANVDKEISQMCLEAEPFVTTNTSHVTENTNCKSNNLKGNVTKVKNHSQGRFSFSYYKEMKNREMGKIIPPAEDDKVECKEKKKADGIWFVECVHQMSKLKAKMAELSLVNYRKHGRIKEKFVQLFGECDIEEMMPDSPICIEEHLTSCKERIAPWIVKYLMPFYKKRRIKDRQLFKAVAKHIADMLIIENTFPEQEYVNRYIDDYFKNKKVIKTKHDIYL